MNRTLTIAVLLLGTLALAYARNNVGAVAPANLLGPRVVAVADLSNQTAPIPTTTIFTAPRSGLYRVSSYIVTTTPGNLDNGFWVLWLGWTDEAGAETTDLLELRGVVTPSVANGYTPLPGENLGTPGGGPSFVLHAIAGTPIGTR
jgi:hypothetical protein